MYNPVRGGTRGGQGDFKWSDVASDKDRENYLGHSVNAPVGRWQNGKDLTWYNKDGKEATEGEKEDKRREEIRAIKEAEEDALAVALGFAPIVRPPRPLPGSTTQEDESNDSVLAKAAARAAEKEAHRKEKEERRKERAQKREEREKKRVGEGGKERRRSKSPRRERSERREGEDERDRDHRRPREERAYEDRERRRGDGYDRDRRGGSERRRDEPERERYRPRDDDRDSSRRHDGFGGKERSRSPAGRRH